MRPATLAYPDLIRRAAAEGAWVHTPSQFVADQVVAELGIDPGRVRAVHHGVPSPPNGAGPRPTVPVSLPEGCHRYVLAVGTIEPRKDYPLLVSAFASVAASHPDVALVIVGGDGWGVGRYLAAVAASPVPHRILRPGYLDDAGAGRRLPERLGAGLSRRATKASGSPRCRPWPWGSRWWPPQPAPSPRWWVTAPC